MRDPSSADAPLILFDGVCNLCNAAVQWVIEHDPAKRLRFASLQSAAGRAALSAVGQDQRTDSLPDGIVLIEAGMVYTRSTALIRLCRHLSVPYRVAGILMVIPRSLRDLVYGFVARNRYRWFGRRDTCTIPTPELAERFLDADEPRPLIPLGDSAISAPNERQR